MTTQDPTPHDINEVKPPVVDTPPIVDETHQEAADSPKEKVVNHTARIAFAGAMVAELLFLLSAFVPYKVSLVFSGISALLALASVVLGCVALRRRPRNLAVAALVFAGVLVIIYLIVTALFFMLPELLNSNT
ncbi:MAG: hypothetical protein K2L93_00815 [Muribaculaceae bacterium]|nr:hypothetical protein [Muribaculaceae bacterium]